MGYDYAQVHLYYTIPPAIILSFLYRPLSTAIDVYKVLFLIFIAVTATIPWDSYLIRNNVWSYPADAIVGPTLLSIPAEELFFFVIQTYNTTLLYLFLNKPTFHSIYLKSRKDDNLTLKKWTGTATIAVALGYGSLLVVRHGQGFYMGLILIWATPFILLLWTLAYQLICSLPWTNTILPIALPTFYLWIVDTIALRRGTWVIESGTKLGWQIWRGLEIEEAVFFLVTNMLIVFGLVAFDNAVAVLIAFPHLFPGLPRLPSPVLLVKALLVPTASYDQRRLDGFRDALATLRKKSRSFYLASGVFQGRLRADLILLYSFCRVADDLVDNASTEKEAHQFISQLREFLDASYSKKSSAHLTAIIRKFPESTRLALELLPTEYLSHRPLYSLLKGFEMDLEFSKSFPIFDQTTLELYGARVAGTVAELIIELVYHHSSSKTTAAERRQIVHAGNTMGVALQLVNIARDIQVDANIKRVYIPTEWLKERSLSPEDIITNPDRAEVVDLRRKLLSHAMDLYSAAKPKIELLPSEARSSMRVAVESYMEIGRVLQEPSYKVKAGRATVPKLRRILVGWRALAA